MRTPSPSRSATGPRRRRATSFLDDGPRGPRAALVTLGLRLLSVALFLFVLLAWKMGWMRPSGLPVGR